MTWFVRLRPHAARIAALALVAVGYGLARIPAPSPQVLDTLAARFRFVPITIDELDGSPHHTVRQVHPRLQRIQAWVSSLGASIAFHDMDGDGLPNDLCMVDPRSDRVIVQPAPGTSATYAAFALNQPDRRAFVAPTGCLPGDLNGDGAPDLLVLYWGRPPIAYLQRADPDAPPAPLGPERFVARDAWDPREVWNTNTGTLADLDGDGHLDLVVGNYWPDGVRLLDPTAEGDAPMQHSMSRAYNGGRNRLLLFASGTTGDAPDVRFHDASAAMGEDALRGWTHALGAADLDRDGRPEVMFVNDFGPDRLFHNRSTPGRLSFVEATGTRGWLVPASKVLGHDSFKGMGIDFGDVNGDLVPDIYVSNIAREGIALESHALYESTGPMSALANGLAPYVERSEPRGLSRSGWAWDCKLADFDNDGTLEAVQATGFVRGQTNRWPETHELAMGNDELVSSTTWWPRVQPGDDISGRELNAFFVQDPAGRFEDVAPRLALEPKDDPFVTRGIAIADVDGDGDLDFAVANQWQPFVFYRNDAPRAGRSLTLDVRQPAGVVSAAWRPAVGATVVVTRADGRRAATVIDGGNGHTGRRSQDAHVGLGETTSDERLRVEITWRDASGRHQDAFTLAPGHHVVRLGERAAAETTHD